MADLATRPPLTDEFGENMAHASILVIDDEPGMRNFLTKTLAPRCKRVEQAASAAEASAILDQAHFDLIILDNIMPGTTGLDWARQQNQVGLYADTILITAYADLDTAIKALRTGVADFVLKPFRANQILNAVARALDRKNLRRENTLLKHELSAENSGARGRLLGNSPAISEVRAMLHRLAPPADFGSVHRTKRHRQGNRGAHPAFAVGSCRQAICRDQLRHDLARPYRPRTVR